MAEGLARYVSELSETSATILSDNMVSSIIGFFFLHKAIVVGLEMDEIACAMQ